MDTNTKTRHLLCVCQWHVDPVIVSCVGISGGLEIVPSLTACCSGRREAAGNPVSHCNFSVKTDRVLAVCRPPAASASVLQRARRTYACDIFWGMDSHITAKIIYDYHSKIMQNSVIWSGALPRYLITHFTAAWRWRLQDACQTREDIASRSPQERPKLVHAQCWRDSWSFLMVALLLKVTGNANSC